jgi:hypothetical protein
LLAVIKPRALLTVMTLMLMMPSGGMEVLLALIPLHFLRSGSQAQVLAIQTLHIP